MKADNFFSDSEKEKIFQTIGEVETKTAGEVAVMVVDKSDTYPESNILCGVIVGGLLALIIADQFLYESLWYFFPLFIVTASLIGWGVKYFPSLRLNFVTNGRLENQVREEAVKSFYEKGLYKTIDKTGVLFFISIFERRVWILADEGIYAKITQEKLQGYASSIAGGIKERKATEALIRELINVGEILAEHFPVKPNDINELSNKVIVG